MGIDPLQFEAMQRRTRKARGEEEEPPPPPPSKAVEKELDLHEDIMQFCNAQWPPWPFLHSDPAKRSRVTPGAPDFVIAMNGGKTLFVECKDRDGKLSADQLIFQKKLEMNSHTLHVIRSMDEFRKLI